MNWSKVDPSSTLNWLWTSSDVRALEQRFQRRVQQLVLEEMVKRGEIQSALDISIEQSNPVWQGWVIGEVALHRGSTTAIEMLHQVRDPIARRSAYHGVGHALIKEGKSTQAIELVSQESPENQFQYFLDMRGHWSDDPQDLFSKLDSLPTEKIKRELAAVLAAKNTGQHSLTSEQKKILKDILPASWHAALD